MKTMKFLLFLFGGAALGLVLSLLYGGVMTIIRPVQGSGALIGGMGALVFVYYLVICVVGTVSGALLGVGAYFLVPRLGWSVFLRGVCLTAIVLFVVHVILQIV